MKTKTKKSKFPKLPVAFKRKWVAALRSGKYKQTSGHLHNEEGYCCMGVAAVIGGNDPCKIPPTKGYIEGGGMDLSKIPDPITGVNDLTNDLCMKNDSGKWSFRRIATWIEKTL